MAEQVAAELARGIRLSPPSKRPKTVPLHDPFFVGTPEEIDSHLKRLEAKRKCEDLPQVKLSQGGVLGPRRFKIARRSLRQVSVADLECLSRKLSDFEINDPINEVDNPCRVVALYQPNLQAKPIIEDQTNLEEPLEIEEPWWFFRSRSGFSFQTEDLSKALIIYPEEHPLQPVIDRIREWQRRMGQSSVKIEEISDDIDEDGQTVDMLEEKANDAETENGMRYLHVHQEEGEDRTDEVAECQSHFNPTADDRTKEVIFLPTSSWSPSSSSSSPLLFSYLSSGTPFFYLTTT